MRWPLLIAGLAMPAAAPAADPICADRPGKATAPCTVPAGRVQIETGLIDWSRQSDGGARATSLTLAETRFKLGIDDRSDLEVDLSPWSRSSSRPGGTHEGFGDVSIAYKYRVTPADAALQVSLLPTVKLPTARRPLGNGKVEGGLLLPIAYAIGKTPLGIGLTPEIDVAANGDGHGYHAAMAQVVSLGWQATSRLNLSGELWGQWDWDPAGTVRQASVDGAFAWLLRDDLQVDGGANLGLNRNTPDLELYAGVSTRF